MFSSPWIIIPAVVALVLFVLYAATLMFLVYFAEYFVRGAVGADASEKPIRGEPLAAFERLLGQSRMHASHPLSETTRPRRADLTRRTG
ncbi:MAG TPA: hypothetical protein VH020_08885 [Stellaceae bacterium]|jgi:hypothetical protein|nr:hypothetical protein [Stellaceae bacterium]